MQVNDQVHVLQCREVNRLGLPGLYETILDTSGPELCCALQVQLSIIAQPPLLPMLMPAQSMLPACPLLIIEWHTKLKAIASACRHAHVQYHSCCCLRAGFFVSLSYPSTPTESEQASCLWLTCGQLQCCHISSATVSSVAVFLAPWIPVLNHDIMHWLTGLNS